MKTPQAKFRPDKSCRLVAASALLLCLFAVDLNSLAQTAALPETVVLSGHQMASNRVYRFFFEAAAGRTYPIETSMDMVNWTRLTNAVGGDGPLWIEDADAANFEHRFYHVGIAPKPAPIPIANMVFISPGTFTMGSPESEPDHEAKETPQTVVTLTRGFWIGKYEVNQIEYVALIGFPQAIFSFDARLPVDFASWVNATNYCEKLTRQEVATGHLPAGWRYRLPTEAEWEYACRAGTTTPVAIGNGTNLSSFEANFDGGFPYNGAATGPFRNVTTIGGTFPPNAWGLYDMHGNDAEWCLDFYGPYSGGAVTDPQGPATGSTRVLRGGGWNSAGRGCRSAKRDARSPTFNQFAQGFRVVLAADPVIP